MKTLTFRRACTFLAAVTPLLVGARPGLGANILGAAIGVGRTPVGLAVNSKTNQIYVTNYGSATVSVIDGATNQVRTTIDVGNNPRGVAVNPDTGRVYVSNENSDTVSVIDETTLKVVKTLHVGMGPFCLAIDPTNRRVFVANLRSSDVTVIEGSSDTVLIQSIPVGRSPEGGVAVNPLTNQVYVTQGLRNSNGKRSIAVFDGASNTPVVREVELEDVGQPYGVAVNPKTNKIYVACVNFSNAGAVEVIDGGSNQRVDGFTIPNLAMTHGIAIDPERNLLFLSSWLRPAMGIINLATIQAELVALDQGDAGLASVEVAVNTQTGRAYVANTFPNTVSVVGANF